MRILISWKFLKIRCCKYQMSLGRRITDPLEPSMCNIPHTEEVGVLSGSFVLWRELLDFIEKPSWHSSIHRAMSGSVNYIVFRLEALLANEREEGRKGKQKNAKSESRLVAAYSSFLFCCLLSGSSLTGFPCADFQTVAHPARLSPNFSNMVDPPDRTICSKPAKAAPVAARLHGASHETSLCLRKERHPQIQVSPVDCGRQQLVYASQRRSEPQGSLSFQSVQNPIHQPLLCWYTSVARATGVPEALLWQKQKPETQIEKVFVLSLICAEHQTVYILCLPFFCIKRLENLSFG